MKKIFLSILVACTYLSVLQAAFDIHIVTALKNADTFALGKALKGKTLTLKEKQLYSELALEMVIFYRNKLQAEDLSTRDCAVAHRYFLASSLLLTFAIPGFICISVNEWPKTGALGIISTAGLIYLSIKSGRQANREYYAKFVANYDNAINNRQMIASLD